MGGATPLHGPDLATTSDPIVGAVQPDPDPFSLGWGSGAVLIQMCWEGGSDGDGVALIWMCVWRGMKIGASR